MTDALRKAGHLAYVVLGLPISEAAFVILDSVLDSLDGADVDSVRDGRWASELAYWQSGCGVVGVSTLELAETWTALQAWQADCSEYYPDDRADWVATDYIGADLNAIVYAVADAVAHLHGEMEEVTA